MFRIVAFCDDKNVVPCLDALRGIAMIPEPPQRVENATMANGKVKSITNGQAVSVFRDHVKRLKTKQVTPADLRRFCQTTLNKSESYYAYLLKNLLEHGALKKVAGKAGKHAAYQVLK